MAAYIFDSEWTDRKNPEIIQAANLCLVPGQDLLGRVPELICRPVAFSAASERNYKPSRRISFGAMAKHHIFEDELERCQPSSSVRIPEDCDYLIGHSIDEDWKAYVNTVGYEFVPSIHPRRICTHAIATHLWQDADSFSLVSLCYMLSGKEARELAKAAHGALADVFLCKLLLEHIVAAKPDLQTWEQLWKFSEDCRIPIYCPFKNREGVKIVDLDDGYLDWVLNQTWIDPYLRTACERVVQARGGGSRARRFLDHDDYGDDDDDDDSWVHPTDMEAQG